MGLDIVVRTPTGEPATESNTGVIQLYQLHKNVDASRSVAASTAASVGASLKFDPLPASLGPHGSPPPPRKTVVNQQFKNAAAVLRKSILIHKREGSSDASSQPATSALLQQQLAHQQQPHHIFLDLKIFMCSVGEPTELYFSLYSKSESKFITEEFQVGLTAQGMPHNVEMIGKLSTLFVDISRKELQQELYLVCRLIRRGRMLTDSNKKAGALSYRRPFGCAVLKIEDNVAYAKELEHTMPIYTASQESSFSTLHEHIIKGGSSLSQVPKAKGICVGIALLPGRLKHVVRDNPVLKDVPKTNKLGFPEIVYPGDTRNDMYITLECGEYSQDRKTSAKNVEVVIQARLENGDLVKDCLYTGDKPVSEYKSMIYYHSNQPHWSETIRVNVPLAILDQVYLVMSIRHCTTSELKERAPYAISYLKLTNVDGTVVENKLHSLVTYKPAKTTEEFMASIKDQATLSHSMRKAEVTKIKVQLCSTVCTQNLSLLSLLRWDQSSGDLSEVLNRFTFVDQFEIIKFMEETFKALFAILEARRVQNPDQVFNVITSIIGLLVDEKTSKYTNFRQVLDKYVEKHFTSSVVHNQLVVSLKRILADSNNLKTIISSLKSMEYIIKFIVTSKVNYDRTHPDGLNTAFKTELTGVFFALSALMKRTEREYIGAQTFALRIFSSLFTDLGQLFSISERASIAIDFINSVRFDESLRLLNMEKMNVMLRLVEGELFLHRESRDPLLVTIKEQLRQHMTSTFITLEDVKKQAEIISALIDTIQSRLKDANLLMELVDIIPCILQSIRSCHQYDVSRLDMVHNLLSLLHLLRSDQFDRYVNTPPDQTAKWDKIHELLIVLDMILAPSFTYPASWFTLNMFQYSTIKKVIIQISDHLLKFNVVPWDDRKSEIWASFFTLINSYLKVQSLALENFSEAKQLTTRQKYGDMRNDLIPTVEKVWKHLDKHQIQLLPVVIGQFIELMMINQDKLKQLGINLYYELLRCEYRDFRSFKKVETETINTLDQITNQETSDTFKEQFKMFFTSNLEAKINGDALIKQPGLIFTRDMKKFLELLCALRTLPDKPEYEDDRTVAAIQLMTYLKQTDRQDTYIKYSHLLCNQHLTNLNYVEAGNTLLLHAELLQWSDNLLEELPYIDGYPAQSERERKERLFKQAIEYFDKGKAWERAISLMKQLIIQYEEVMFDYQKLADVLQQESTFYRKIIGVDRFFAEYFRVAYYGSGFDESIRGKEFIYKGLEVERMSEFVKRIHSKHPNANILPYTEAPPEYVLNSTDQYLQIFSVKPAPKEEKLLKAPPASRKSVPVTIQKHHLYNNIETFVYSKPTKKKASPSSSSMSVAANEFGELWITNYYYEVQDTFPTIHKRSEIKRKHEQTVSPIENAINSVIAKNSELQEMSTKHGHGKDINLSAFTMVLKGVIDAAVNGGVNMYKKVFFTAAYITDNKDKVEAVERLRAALHTQVQILKRCLTVHSKVCSHEMGGLQEQLEIQFEKMKLELGYDGF
ncbi:hypothetical protein SAMD00019534_058910 [Acytostelium subglobosum LB1]|uniref:hypothetical protein n=1 Tax=Acytostelium subglobosum LB1 TaxID=1410327 RepID=UPI000645034F|nr:hypothetical protein SAMD00019534_058910 [Acytostelium subglobosum LB1]GAM22716.1 hypothetical protein SAMD00019534_058910 [Acytostelium subglobosum LB1]|eukprot:XP_012753943.1 hypothetical protein SAMD00019534_058910 [Acytostelium subglobosum LB1]